MPAVAVARDGTIGVSYYDFRSDKPDSTISSTDYWLARSTDGSTWSEVHVAGPFDLRIAPFSDGLFLGDYQSLASVGLRFVPFFARTNAADTGNRTDIVTVPVRSTLIPASESIPAQGSEHRAAPLTSLAIGGSLAQHVRDQLVRIKRQRLQRFTPDSNR